jgi:hypothetical protein
MTARNFATDHEAVKDLERYPELRWLDRYDIAVPVALAVALTAFGAWLGPAPLRHRRRQPQQLAAGAAHLRRGLAQQPPSFPRLGAPGLHLVGSRPDLVRVARDGRAGPGLGPEEHAGLDAERAP